MPAKAKRKSSSATSVVSPELVPEITPVARVELTLVYGAAITAAFSAVAYELLLASYATFLMGATVLQYSLVVSLMMASMGIGALLTQRTHDKALAYLIGAELILTVCAAVAIPVMYYVFSTDFFPRVFLFSFVFVMGAALGMEVPLLTQIHKSASGSRQGLTRVLFCDYLGGFFGGLAFPIWLLPTLGFFRIAAILSMLNGVLSLALVLGLRRKLGGRFPAWACTAGIATLLGIAAFFGAEPLRIYMEQSLFQISH